MTELRRSVACWLITSCCPCAPLMADINVGAGGGPPATSSYGHVTGISGGVPVDGAWLVGISLQTLVTDPVGIAADATAGPWIKSLGGEVALLQPPPPVIPALHVQEGSTFALLEFVQIGGISPWTTWSSQILTAGWEWVHPGSSLVGTPPVPNDPGTVNPAANLQLTSTATLNTFTFDPIGVGQIVGVRSFLRFVGTDSGSSDEVFNGYLEVAQAPAALAPIPAPGSAMMGLLGCVTLWMRRRSN